MTAPIDNPQNADKQLYDRLYMLLVKHSEGFVSGISEDNIGKVIGHGCQDFAQYEVNKKTGKTELVTHNAAKFFHGKEITQQQAEDLIPKTRLNKLQMCRDSFPNFDKLTYEQQTALELMAYKSTDRKIVDLAGGVKAALKSGDMNAVEAAIRNSYARKSVYTPAWARNQDIIADMFAGKIESAIDKCAYYVDDKKAYIAEAQAIIPEYKNDKLYIANIMADPLKAAKLEEAVANAGKRNDMVERFQRATGIDIGVVGEVTQYAYQLLKNAGGKVDASLTTQALAFQNAKPTERALLAALPLPNANNLVAGATNPLLPPMFAAAEAPAAQTLHFTPVAPKIEYLKLADEVVEHLKMAKPPFDAAKNQIAEILTPELPPKNLRTQVPLAPEPDKRLQTLANSAKTATPLEPEIEIKPAIPVTNAGVVVAGMFSRINPQDGKPVLVRQTSGELSEVERITAKAVQKSLTLLGYAKIEEDELGFVAGGKTADGIEALQKDVKLNPDRVAGRKTYAALEVKLVSEMTKKPEIREKMAVIVQEFEADYSKHMHKLVADSKEMPNSGQKHSELPIPQAQASQGVAPS